MKKLLIGLVVFFSSFLILKANVKAISNQDVYLDYSSNNLDIIDTNYDIVEDLIELIDTYNNRNFGVVIYFQNISGSDIYRIGVSVSQRPTNSNSYLKIMTYLRYDDVNSYYTFNNRTGIFQNVSGCYFGQGDCEARTSLTLSDNISQSDLNTFYSNVQNLLTTTQSSYNGLFPAQNTIFNTTSFELFDMSYFLAYIWSNIEIQYHKGPNTSGTNYINNLYVNDVVVQDDSKWLTYSEYLENLNPTISFNYSSYTNNNIVYKGVVSIDFGNINNNSFIYQIYNDYTNTWKTITPDGIYNVDFYKNGYIVARIIDKSTGDLIDQNTFNVTGIESDFDITFFQSNLYDFNRSTNGIQLSISYYSQNEEIYKYAYEIYNHVDETISPIQIVGGNTQILYISENSTITAYIYSINDTNLENVLYSKAYSVNDINILPKITMSADPPRLVDGYNRIAVGISFGNYIPTKYKYEYAHHYDSNSNDEIIWYQWNDELPRCYVDMSYNGIVLAKITRLSDNTIIDEQTFYVTGLTNTIPNGIDLSETFNFIISGENINNTVLPFIALFTQSYTALNTSSNISFYLIIIISTSGIILVFKHFKK